MDEVYSVFFIAVFDQYLHNLVSNFYIILHENRDCPLRNVIRQLSPEVAAGKIVGNRACLVPKIKSLARLLVLTQKARAERVV